MTTPPRVRRFNITDPAEADAAATTAAAKPMIRVQMHKRKAPEAGAMPPPATPAHANDANTPLDAAGNLMANNDQTDDGFGERRFPTAAQPEAPAKGDADLDAKIQAVRGEKLTKRQLRIARRIAGLHQIPVQSDEEAVVRLRERGIDPSHRGAVGQILSAAGHEAQSAPAPNAPAVARQTPPPAPMPQPSALPSREALTEQKRAAEIMAIQRDLARRRRRRMAMMLARLAFFVLLPTAIAGWYYYRVATPLYATHSQFQIQMAEMPKSAGGSAMAGGAMMINSDFVAVQSYLTSRDAMLRLDNDHGFKAAFQDPRSTRSNAWHPMPRMRPPMASIRTRSKSAMTRPRA